MKQFLNSFIGSMLGVLVVGLICIGSHNCCKRELCDCKCCVKCDCCENCKCTVGTCNCKISK